MHQHFRNNFFDNLRQRGHSPNTRRQIWTPVDLASLRPSHRRVSTCRLQNGQGQAGRLSGLARGTKVLPWRAMGIPLST
jgi:hypothetical protein